MVSKVVALAGGVGGARLSHGLYQVLPEGNLTIIVNTGDDFIFNGLNISPDLDTVCYTLADIANYERGWGIHNDSFQVLDQIRKLGGESWFSIGDKDLATHLYRTSEINHGTRLSDVTKLICQKLGISAKVIPMSDEVIQTKIRDQNGTWMDFQEYFVHQQCQPKVKEFKFSGIEKAKPAPGVLEAISESDLIIICPSNPWVSIDPILGIAGIAEAFASKCAIAVSPLIGGNAVKGPLAKMYLELGISASSVSVAEHYKELINGIVIDHIDHAEIGPIEAFGIITQTLEILMKDIKDRKRLAIEVLRFGDTLLNLL